MYLYTHIHVHVYVVMLKMHALRVKALSHLVRLRDRKTYVHVVFTITGDD